jgi:hypothetical protein
VVLLLALGLTVPTLLSAQTIDDGVMLTRGSLFVGDLYTHDAWDQYWEGALKRDNGNIGTITTETNTIFANYGVTDHLNVITTIPYVWTNASKGVLHGMSGFQDITMVAKYSLLDTAFTSHGTMRAIGLFSGSLPLTDYTPDFQPLSIGMAAKRWSGRFTLNFQSNPGWFGNGSMAYTWRGDVTLDRPFYYTNGQLTFSDKVDMPNVFDYIVSGGYMKHDLMAAAFVSEQNTRGGGDIRRQDMPFVSNRMNFTSVGGMVMYPIPKFHAVRARFVYSHIVDGRNVGQSDSFTIGGLYLFNFHSSRPTQ